MNVLLVDDEDIIRKGVGKLLRNVPQTISDIFEAKNGRIALEVIEREKPDLIITDIRMPVMDGLSLAKAVWSDFPDIELVILTGYADFQYARQAIIHGVSDYLLKPVTQEHLNKVIIRMLMRNPAKWMDQMDVLRLRELKTTVTVTVKNVLSENRPGVEKALREWHDKCMQWKLSLSEMKQLFSYMQLAYKAEMLQHQHELPVHEQPHDLPGASVDEMFRRFLGYCFSHIDNISGKRSPRNKRVVDQVIREIGNYYGDPELGIHALAEKANVSAAYLSKMFREIMQKPITHYISEYRLEQARNLMEVEEQTKIARIAELCGFVDYPYFSKIFKKKFGVSPQEYRDKYFSS
jgi:two-component system response regulator YesN